MALFYDTFILSAFIDFFNLRFTLKFLVFLLSRTNHLENSLVA